MTKFGSGMLGLGAAIIGVGAGICCGSGAAANASEVDPITHCVVDIGEVIGIVREVVDEALLKALSSLGFQLRGESSYKGP